MNSFINMLPEAASLGRAKCLARAIALASTVGLNGATGVGLLRISGLGITFATSAQAWCLLSGDMRNDVADSDCPEAQRTGCIRRRLTPDQYRNCIQANRELEQSGRVCMIGGTFRRDLSLRDCEEAKRTGCVQRLLTDEQYRGCLEAQPSRAARPYRPPPTPADESPKFLGKVKPPPAGPYRDRRPVIIDDN